MRKESTLSFIILMPDLQPVLYWLHRDVPAEQAPGYWRALHELVYSLGWFSYKGYGSIVLGTEFLLRIFCFRPDFISCQGKGYCGDKFRCALDDYQTYFEKVGSPLFSSHYSFGELSKVPFDDLYGRLCEHFDQWASRMAEVRSEHAAWVRFVQALVGHLGDLESAGVFLGVDERVQKPLYEMLRHFLGSGFRLDLPEGEGSALHDLWATCERAWVKMQTP